MQKVARKVKIMKQEKRMNANYEIIKSENTVYGYEVVIGYNSQAVDPYVCWSCYNGNDYRAGEYCQTKEEVNEIYQSLIS